MNRPNQNKSNVPFTSHPSVVENYRQISYLQENEQDWCLTGRFPDVVRVSPKDTGDNMMAYFTWMKERQSWCFSQDLKQANMATTPALEPAETPVFFKTSQTPRWRWSNNHNLQQTNRLFSTLRSLLWFVEIKLPRWSTGTRFWLNRTHLVSFARLLQAGRHHDNSAKKKKKGKI